MSTPAIRAQGGIELLAQLESAGAVTKTGLQLPPDLPFDQYEALALMLGHLHRKSAWLIGDLINFGEKVYGEKYTQAIELTQLHPQTLINYASVCAHVPQQRRRLNLSFAVHAAVAYKEPEEQEMWLSLAEEKGWKRRELRAAMNGDNAEPVRDPGPEVLPPAVALTHCPHCGGPLNGYVPGGYVPASPDAT